MVVAAALEYHGHPDHNQFDMVIITRILTLYNRHMQYTSLHTYSFWYTCEVSSSQLHETSLAFLQNATSCLFWWKEMSTCYKIDYWIYKHPWYEKSIFVCNLLKQYSYQYIQAVLRIITRMKWSFLFLSPFLSLTHTLPICVCTTNVWYLLASLDYDFIGGSNELNVLFIQLKRDHVGLIISCDISI